MSELRDNVREEIERIYTDALSNGYVNEDDICDELNDYFDEVEDCDDAVLKQAYGLALDAMDDDGVAKLKAALDLLAA